MADPPVLVRASRGLLEGKLIADVWLEHARGIVTAIGHGAAPREPDVDLLGQTLAPGFVDIHCHGGAGTAFDSDEADWDAALSFHAAHGTTRQAVSLVTAPLDVLERRVRAVVDALSGNPAVLGIHLEGPFLADSHRGAHDAASLTVPTLEAVDRLIEAGDGRLLQVTIAPELSGAIAAIRRFVDAGVRVAIGHTGCDAAAARAAFDAGATILTHACNGMPPIHHRSPGPLAVAMLDERVTLEAIADGEHLQPEMLALLAQGVPGRLALVTDAMAAAGMPDGAYRVGSLDVRVEQGMPRLDQGGALAGSTLTMDRAVATLVTAGAPLEQALDAASRAPADAVGRSDLGRFAIGAEADFVALSDRGEASGVWRSGQPVEL